MSIEKIRIKRGVFLGVILREDNKVSSVFLDDKTGKIDFRKSVREFFSTAIIENIPGIPPDRHFYVAQEGFRTVSELKEFVRWLKKQNKTPQISK